MPKYTKEELIIACRKKNAKAQLYLYDLHSRYLFTVSWRILQEEKKAEDVVHEVLLRFFEESIYTLKEPNFYLSYLKKMVVNRSIDLWKKEKNLLSLDTDEILALEEEEESEGDFEMQWESLLQQVSKLPERYRMMIELYYLQEYSHQEIGEILKISNSNSRVLLKRALHKLKIYCHEA